jgi:DNA-binding HxlR family transcriptional regulator
MAREEDAMSSAYPTQQGCPVARSLELIGDRWTLLVVRDLLRGRTRFSDLLESLEGISPNLLSSRLKRLERAGIVQRRFYTQHPPRAEYLLTEKGRALSPVVRSIYEWGEQHSPRRARAR